MQDISVTFRIAVNTNREKIIDILKKINCIYIVLLEEKLVIDKNNVVISYNEDYDEKLAAVDKDAYLYYENNIDFYPNDDSITLENQIQLAKKILKKFIEYGISSEIIAEFENQL